MPPEWRFVDPQQTEVITLGRILRGESSVMLVTHDADDGGWQFLDGEHVFEDDGLVVCLGEMVQFDASLVELGDLPPGWYAWRTTPDQPWQSAEGEPLAVPIPARIDPIPDHPRARNIEIKARVADLEHLRTIVEPLSESEVEILNQEDIFFRSPEGRLKLRILNEVTGELIHYHRPDTADPKASHYLIAPTSAPLTLKSILSMALPVIGVVRKRRLLYRVGQTRIHLDRVEGLGDFLELEVVLRPDQTEAEGVAIATDLMGRLQITQDDLIKTAYIDMVHHGA
jgi:predicted adenylyl cyclase CyaB